MDLMKQRSSTTSAVRGRKSHTHERLWPYCLNPVKAGSVIFGLPWVIVLKRLLPCTDSGISLPRHFSICGL